MASRRRSLMAAVLAVAACGGERPTGVGPSRSVLGSRVAPPSGARCMPASGARYAAPFIPAQDAACLFYDRIFDPRGPVFPNPMREKNLVVTRPERVPQYPKAWARRQVSGTLLQPGTGDAGWFVNSYYLRWGRGAFEVVNPTLEIPSNIADAAPPDIGDQIFAPTNKPRDGCLELSVIYWRMPNAATTTRELGWYDFCQSPPDWVTIEDITDPQWAFDYIINDYVPATGEYEDQIYWGLESLAGTDCWQGILFNFGASHYDQKALACGTPSNEGGWSVWESYYVMDFLSDASQCPVIPRVWADVIVYIDTVNWYWHPLNHADISQFATGQPCRTSGFYALDWYAPSDSSTNMELWKALTP